MLVGARQHANSASGLDGVGQLLLVLGRAASHRARQDLASRGQELRQDSRHSVQGQRVDTRTLKRVDNVLATLSVGLAVHVDTVVGEVKGVKRLAGSEVGGEARGNLERGLGRLLDLARHTNKVRV